MAVEYGDHASGFRHTEVIKFINNEVFVNGGGPEFYMNYRSRPWNEIEDQLQIILVDPKVPRSLKRACTWSALALSVRVAARQREQQARRVGQLQDEMGARETASWTLASELQRLRDERDQAATQLQLTQSALQEAMDEREVLRGRLLQAERSAMDDPSSDVAQNYMAAPCSLGEEKQAEVESRGTQNIAPLKVQLSFPTNLSYVPGSPSPWGQEVQSFIQMPVAQPQAVNLPLSTGVSYSTPIPCPAAMESEATAATMTTVLPQIATAGIYSTGLWPQEATTPMWGQINHNQNECHEKFQGRCYLEDSRCHSEEGTEKSQEASLSGDNTNHSQKENQVIYQGMAPTEKKDPVIQQEKITLEVNTSHSTTEDSVMPPRSAAWEIKTGCSEKKYPGFLIQMLDQGNGTSNNIKKNAVMHQQKAAQGSTPTYSQQRYPGICLRKAALEDSFSCNQKEDSKMSQEIGALGDSNRHCQKEAAVMLQQKTPLGTGRSHSQKKDQVMSQSMVALGAGRSQIQKEGPDRHQISPLEKTRSHYVNKCPKKQLPPKQKTKQTSGSKTAEPKPQDKPSLNHIPINWVCPSCKGVNGSRRRACHKCTKVSVLFESRDVVSRQIH